MLCMAPASGGDWAATDRGGAAIDTNQRQYDCKRGNRWNQTHGTPTGGGTHAISGDAPTFVHGLRFADALERTLAVANREQRVGLEHQCRPLGAGALVGIVMRQLVAAWRSTNRWE